MFASSIASANKYILIHPKTRKTEVENGFQWVDTITHDEEMVIATQKKYIQQVLLPTFRNYDPINEIDPQFIKDFKRAAPCPNTHHQALRWLCNSQNMNRNVNEILRKLRKWNSSYLSIITAVFNQRIGIDLCRRVFSISGSGIMVLPDSSSFTLELKLPSNAKQPSIIAHAKMSIHSYSETGVLVHTPKDLIYVYGHYNLDSGQVVYIVKRK